MLEAYTLSQSYDRLLEEHKALQQQLTEKDATITTLRKALEEAKGNIQTIYFNCESPMTVTSNCEDAIREINSALGEGDKE